MAAAPLCPRCGDRMSPVRALTAMSRFDNFTLICPACGVEEALIQFMNPTRPKAAIHPITGDAPWPDSPIRARVAHPSNTRRESE